MGFFDVTSGPSITFPTVGTKAGGTIAGEYTERQANDFITDKPKFDDNGKPVMMACVPIQVTERDPLIPQDDGVRTLYVEKVGMKIAIGEALKASGASDLEVGGTLFVTWTGETPSTKGSPLKTWSAEYARPVGSLGVTPAAGSTVTGLTLPAATTAPPTVTAPAGPDLVAIARAAQVKLAAETAAMEAKAKTAPAATNGHDPSADIAKIKELLALGIPAAAVHTAMPAYSMEAITAVGLM